MAQAEQTAIATFEEADPELVDLPAPPRVRRFAAMTVMALSVAASLAFLTTLRSDIGYFFANATAEDLGDAMAVDAAALEPNTYVRVSGSPMASGTVRYSRMFSGTYAVYPLAGQRTIFVQIPLDGPQDERLLQRREYAGRLVTFGQLGSRFGPVERYLDGRMDLEVSGESFLLLADQPPRTYSWALFLAALCVLFVFLNVFLLWRWFRPLPTS
ncbi:MAG: hypothetical protein AAGF12_42040 [Myxococcota bacterium]